MNPDIVVLDLNQIPPEIRYDLETIWFQGILSGESLRQLAYLADERKARDAERLAMVLYG
jgi:hypothetical protein